VPTNRRLDEEKEGSVQAMRGTSRALDGSRPEPTGFDRGRPDDQAGLPSGVRVQVRNRFDGAWASGYQVLAAQPGGGYLVRRMSDHSVLPMTFADAELRLDPVPLPAVAPNQWSPPSFA
jgi:hypothetical protein